MKNRYKKMSLILLLVLITLPNTVVDAATKQIGKCFGDDGLYSITYDDKINTNVDETLIDFQAVKDGHLIYPNGVEDIKYNFTAVKTASKCYMDGDLIKVCPEDSGAFDKIQKAYINYDNGNVNPSENVDMEFDKNSGAFDIAIKDAFSGQYKVRYVYNTSGYNDNNSASFYENSTTNTGGYFLSKHSDGKYRINDVSPNTAVALEFYLNNSGSCNGTFIGRIVIFTKSLDEVEINNPAISNPATYGCDTVKSYVPNGITDVTTFNNIKKNMVPECYSKKLTYNEYLSLSSDVTSDFNSLKSLYSNFTLTTEQGSKECSETYNGATAQGYAASGRYWAISCQENFSSSGAGPKLVSAGSGFSYDATFTVSKSCSIIQITPTPTPREKCHQYCSCECYWYNSRTGASGGGVGEPGGPNDKFDNCVNQCDGGKYTQKCINSCYSESYSKKRNTSFSSNFSLDTRKKSKIEFTSFTGTVSNEEAYNMGLVNKIPGWTSPSGLPGNMYSANGDGGADCSCGESDWCASGNGSCTFHFWVGPSGCVDNPEALYAAEMAQYNSEKSEFESIAAEPVSVGEYTMTITDSYINNGTYKLVLGEHTNPGLNVSVDAPQGSASGSSATIHISLPLSYIDKITSNAVYRTNDNMPFYTLNAKKGKIEQFTGGASRLYGYDDNNRKYYTSVHSPNTNVAFKDGKVVLSGNTYNIEVTAKNVGWSGFSVERKCYYGVYNNYYSNPNASGGNNPTPTTTPTPTPTEPSTPENPTTPGNLCDPAKEICDGGLQYIFRPIVLSDVFPNGRSPRHNWSGEWHTYPIPNDEYGRTYTIGDKGARDASRTVRKYDTDIDPVAYTKNIESKGDTIYEKSSGEIDYEFILTPKNIAAIKAYNKTVNDYNGDGARNYLDYDMSCYTHNGQSICTSNFLDRTDILTYGSGYTVSGRKAIASCNNAKNNGTSCDRSAHK